MLAPLLGGNELLPSKGFLKLIVSDFCSEGFGTILCQNFLFALFGYSPDEINASLLPVIMVHIPAGAATRQLIHYGQEIDSGNNLLEKGQIVLLKIENMNE